ncbi:hypothetical protein P353_00140 [Comamonas testosteroni]|uniref:Uncharacterized protein n=1 Tax=Comamonas testosteroni TaxID=285 RepID=A0A096FR38_COMTE|nr:hypothetical protein P353_00140 [Comamonas testosteroni]
MDAKPNALPYLLQTRMANGLLSKKKLLALYLS